MQRSVGLLETGRARALGYEKKMSLRPGAKATSKVILLINGHYRSFDGSLFFVFADHKLGVNCRCDLPHQRQPNGAGETPEVAEAACSADANCAGLYDEGCNGWCLEALNKTSINKAKRNQQKRKEVLRI